MEEITHNDAIKQYNTRLYKNIVFEGGGVLGNAFVGAMRELENRGYKFTNFAGASAGSIIAGAIACGADIDYIEKKILASDFSKFIDYKNIFYGLYNLVRYKGFCRGDYFKKWYGDILEELTGDRNITLGQRATKYGGRLAVSVTNIDQRESEIMDHNTNPDLPILLLVRASMSIPIIFVPVRIGKSLYVDGGVLNNFPIRAFHENTSSGDTLEEGTLGLLLQTKKELIIPAVSGFSSYIKAILSCYFTQLQKMHLDEQDWKNTIKINCGNISSIDFCITHEDRDGLISAGKAAVEKFFD